ncbi:hypothetical protein E4P42_20465 [Mycobacterium sp. PS03-16]|uniref:hypothetical protein n=1 Tax=Mycobacterium sp. PS03-16 TaxID=2559611 RepID=UPI0010734766|nr:hypothetical protein [Mycobacterium sp. PS03-16]TFV56122.1 hypothetical protein E4P42_20465 [Mycobacterium sp. PS03-16]
MRPTWIFATSIVSLATVLFGPAAAAQAETPQETITRLQQAGYTVNIDRVGSRPIEECVVTGVRNPQTVIERVRVYDGRDDEGSIDWDTVPVVRSRSISVSLNCA